MSQLATAWLAAATFVLTTSAGAFFVGAILRASGVEWSLPIRRVHEAISGALPVAALAFAPFALSLHARDFVALAIVIGFEEWLRAASLAESPRARAIASAALPLTSLALALFADDAIAPHSLSSDAFGMYVLVASFGAGLAATCLVSAALRKRLGLAREQAASLGKLELVACSVWAYVAFSIFLIVWIADLPREVGFFLVRQTGAWGAVFAIVIALRFGVQLPTLVPRAPKRHFGFVGAIAVLTLAAHALECVWLVAPETPAQTAVAFVFAVALVALAIGVSVVRFRRHDALPIPAVHYEAS